MLRNMKVGTKLLAVVLPPLLVLVAVAGFGARDRLAEASDARTAEQYIALSAASGDVVASLQVERALSVYIATGGTSETIESQRSTTDAAIVEFEEQIAAVGTSGPVAEAASIAVDRQEDIATIRSSIDRANIDPLIVHQWYIDTIAKHLDMAIAVSNEVPFPEVSADLSSLVALSRSQEAAAQVQSIMVVALANDEFDAEGRLWRLYLTGASEVTRYDELFFAVSTPSQSAALRGQLASSAAVQTEEFKFGVIHAVTPTIEWLTGGRDLDGVANSITREVGRAPAAERVTMMTPTEWIELTNGTLIDSRRVVSTDLIDGITGLVTESRETTESQALLYLLVTAAAVIISAVLAIVVARRITKPLRNLTDAADRLSTEQLPALVERLKSPGSDADRILLEPINMKRSDEIGHLADAFDAIQRVTLEVAEEQATLLKKGIGDIFVNLARRNQTLLDRQIEFIDQLEQAEEDPDVLEDLFKLDHLATRMRRNAESLLVLAGIETGHRRSRPVPLADVVRVAVGEVEDFARLNLVSMDDAVVTGAAAMDVAHLLSELMENATSFSPPETGVEVLGHLNSDGTYVLSISDQGIGMSDEQFAETNKLLAEPPLVGLTLSRSLGFTVVGRLAARFKIDVRLTSSPAGGVTALVTLPKTILESASIEVDGEPEAIAPPVVVDETAGAEPVGAFAPAEPSADELRHEDSVEWVPDAPVPTTLATAVPEGAAFDAGLAALMGEDGPQEHDDRSGSEAPALFAQATELEAEQVVEAAPVVTAAGLVKRQPRGATATSTDEPVRASDAAPVARTQRSPEEVRAMLSRYRSGLHRGRDTDSPNGDGSN